MTLMVMQLPKLPNNLRDVKVIQGQSPKDVWSANTSEKDGKLFVKKFRRRWRRWTKKSQTWKKKTKQNFLQWYAHAHMLFVHMVDCMCSHGLLNVSSWFVHVSSWFATCVLIFHACVLILYACVHTPTGQRCGQVIQQWHPTRWYVVLGSVRHPGEVSWSFLPGSTCRKFAVQRRHRRSDERYFTNLRVPLWHAGYGHAHTKTTHTHTQRPYIHTDHTCLVTRQE